MGCAPSTQQAEEGRDYELVRDSVMTKDAKEAVEEDMALPGSVEENPLDRPSLPPINGAVDLETSGGRPKTSNPNFRSPGTLPKLIGTGKKFEPISMAPMPEKDLVEEEEEEEEEEITNVHAKDSDADDEAEDDAVINEIGEPVVRESKQSVSGEENREIKEVQEQQEVIEGEEHQEVLGGEAHRESKEEDGENHSEDKLGEPDMGKDVPNDSNKDADIGKDVPNDSNKEADIQDVPIDTNEDNVEKDNATNEEAKDEAKEPQEETKKSPVPNGEVHKHEENNNDPDLIMMAPETMSVPDPAMGGSKISLRSHKSHLQVSLAPSRAGSKHGSRHGSRQSSRHSSRHGSKQASRAASPSPSQTEEGEKISPEIEKAEKAEQLSRKSSAVNVAG